MRYKNSNKNFSKGYLITLSAVLIIFVISLLFAGEGKALSGVYEEFECDYITSNFLQTEIRVTIDGEEYKIKGNVFTLVTDPLTMYDSKNQSIIYAGDTYGFFSQDDHAIYEDGNFVVNVEGLWDMFGESYNLTDKEGNIVAKACFNYGNFSGYIETLDGTLIATYEKGFLMNDYTVKIAENDLFSDKVIHMIIASYVSDYHYDGSSSSSSSSSSRN